MNKTVILGAGIAGLSAAYHLKQKGITSAVFEQESDWGGLCGNFSISGFRFDRFVHLSFAPDEYTQKMFDGTGGMHEHVPYPTNYYHGYWIKHPAQNNLHPLGTEEKINIINGRFRKFPTTKNGSAANTAIISPNIFPLPIHGNTGVLNPESWKPNGSASV